MKTSRIDTKTATIPDEETATPTSSRVNGALTPEELEVVTAGDQSIPLPPSPVPTDDILPGLTVPS